MTRLDAAYWLALLLGAATGMAFFVAGADDQCLATIAMILCGLSLLLLLVSWRRGR